MDSSGVDCDVFISCLDSHSDGTHSLQRIHWWASDVMLLGMFIWGIFPNRQLMLVNQLLTVNRQDYFKLELETYYKE